MKPVVGLINAGNVELIPSWSMKFDTHLVSALHPPVNLKESPRTLNFALNAFVRNKICWWQLSKISIQGHGKTLYHHLAHLACSEPP